jgi:segregation and condensation protein A
MNLIVPTLEIQMESYEGPLATLITLIKKNKVSIWDVPIAFITERFLEYVELIKEFKLKIAEDFIDIASLLLFLKSRMLLPADTTGEEEEETEEEIVQRLIEFEQMRNMATTIGNLPMLNRDIFCRGKDSVEGEVDYDLLLLCKVFFDVITRREERYITVSEIKPTLEEKINMLKSVIDTAGIFVWNIDDEEEHREKVATILGMLELTRTRVVTLTQRRPFGKIVMKKRGDVNPLVSGNESVSMLNKDGG